MDLLQCRRLRQDIADVEDDAIDLPHSWYPSLKLATELCARLNHSRSSIEGQHRTVRHNPKLAVRCVASYLQGYRNLMGLLTLQS